MNGIIYETLRISENKSTFLAQTEELTEFYIRNNWDDDRKRLSDALKNSLIIVIAKCQGKIVGVGRTVGDGFRFVQIVDLLVKEDFRNHGVGKVIIKRLAEFHQRDNCYFIDVATDLRNPEVMNFYRKCGFTETGSTLMTLK